MKYFLPVIAILTLISCKSKKNQMDNDSLVLSEDNFKVILKKGACYGTCPVFTMTIHSDGQVEYEGRSFTDRLGTFTKELSKDQMIEVLQKIDASDFYNLSDRYVSKIADLPMTKITVIDEDNETKTTTFKENKPENLGTLANYLSVIANNESGWTMSKPAPVDADINEDQKADPTIDKTEIIIKPMDGVKIALWFKANKDTYGLFLKKKISPNSNYWLFTYDTKRFTPETIVSVINADPEIESIQFNETVENR